MAGPWAGGGSQQEARGPPPGVCRGRRTAAHPSAGPRLRGGGGRMIRRMNYELFMGEALAEARLAAARGAPPVGAIAVMNEAMVARGSHRVTKGNDPTAHAVVVALREAARKLATPHLSDVTIFTTLEPCPMCVGVLLQCDVAALVYAMPNTGRRRRRHGRPARPAPGPRPPAAGRVGHPPRRGRGAEPPAARPGALGRLTPGSARPCGPAAVRGPFGILSGGEVSEWLMVPLSKSGVRKHRGFESHPLRHTSWSRPGGSPRRVVSCLPERSPRGLGRRTGNAVWGNPSRVRIPPSPPPTLSPAAGSSRPPRSASAGSRRSPTDGRPDRRCTRSSRPTR